MGVTIIDMSQEVRSSALNILIVDPDPGLAESLQKALKVHGINALALDHIENLSSVLQTQNPQLVLAENQFPEMNGIDLTKKVFEDSPGAHEVVLMYQKRPPSLSDAHEAGACHLLQKPINIEELISVYKRYCISENQRRFERVTVGSHESAIFAKIQDAPFGEQRIKISDIGRGGFYFEVEAGTLEGNVGDVINFELTLTMVPKCTFRAQGIVRWVKEGFDKSGAGVEFISLPEDMEKMLHAYVELFKVKAFVPSS